MDATTRVTVLRNEGQHVPQSRKSRVDVRAMIKANQRARRVDTEKDVPAGSAAHLSTDQADKVPKAKNMAAESAAATGQAESAAATGQAAAAASAAASAGEAGSDNVFLERELARVAMGRVRWTPPPPKIDEAPTFDERSASRSFVASIRSVEARQHRRTKATLERASQRRFAASKPGSAEARLGFVPAGNLPKRKWKNRRSAWWRSVESVLRSLVYDHGDLGA